MLTPTYTIYIYIYNTSRFTCSIESSTVNRGLKRVLSFFAKRVHATYIPCVTMCRVYVDTYLKKLRGQRRKKTARPFVHTRDGTVRVCRVCVRACVSLFPGAARNCCLRYTTREHRYRRRTCRKKGAQCVHATRYKGNSLFRVRHPISRSMFPASKRGECTLRLS